MDEVSAPVVLAADLLPGAHGGIPIRIARDWNTRDAASGNVGYVTRFRIRKPFIEQYSVQEAGGRELREYWIPADDLGAFNDNIAGLIEVIHEFRP
jgi:hypothetical protein